MSMYPNVDGLIDPEDPETQLDAGDQLPLSEPELDAMLDLPIIVWTDELLDVLINLAPIRSALPLMDDDAYARELRARQQEQFDRGEFD